MTEEKTPEQLLAEADLLEAQAAQNDAYMASMERTTEKTNGVFGHLNNPTQYAAHQKAAAEKRLRAANLRAKAQHGGARDGAGRPATLDDPTRVTVTLDADHVEQLKKIGDGNVSAAVRSMTDVFASLISKAESLPMDYRGRENESQNNFWHCAWGHFSPPGVECKHCGRTQRESEIEDALNFRRQGFIP